MSQIQQLKAKECISVGVLLAEIGKGPQLLVIVAVAGEQSTAETSLV